MMKKVLLLNYCWPFHQYHDQLEHLLYWFGNFETARRGLPLQCLLSTPRCVCVDDARHSITHHGGKNFLALARISCPWQNNHIIRHVEEKTCVHASPWKMRLLIPLLRISAALTMDFQLSDPQMLGPEIPTKSELQMSARPNDSRGMGYRLFWSCGDSARCQHPQLQPKHSGYPAKRVSTLISPSSRNFTSMM